MSDLSNISNRQRNNANTSIKTSDKSEGYEPAVSALAGITFSDLICDLRETHTGMQLDKELSDEIEHSVSNHPVISWAYKQLLTNADTNMILKVDPESNQERVEDLIKQQIPQLFSFAKTPQDLSNYIKSHLIRYGIFNCIPKFERSKLVKFVIPPAWSIKVKRINNSWEWVQKMDRAPIVIDKRFLIQGSYFPLVDNNEGVWWNIPFKPSIRYSKVYDLYMQSLAVIIEKYKMVASKQLAYSPEALRKQARMTLQGVTQDKHYHDLLNKKETDILKKSAGVIKNSSSGSVAFVDNEIFPEGIKRIDEFEPPESLLAFNELLGTVMASGCMTYGPLLGVYGKENQTTLSTNQKLIISQNVETLQNAANRIQEQIYRWILAYNGVVVDSIEIESEPPQMESKLELEQARQLRLQNDLLEEQILEGRLDSQEQAQEEQENIENESEEVTNNQQENNDDEE